MGINGNSVFGYTDRWPARMQILINSNEIPSQSPIHRHAPIQTVDSFMKKDGAVTPLSAFEFIGQA